MAGSSSIARGEGDSRPVMYSISLRDAEPIMHLLDIPRISNISVQLSSERDELLWRWDNTGRFTSKSAYEALVSGEKVRWQFAKTWKYATTPTV